MCPTHRANTTFVNARKDTREICVKLTEIRVLITLVEKMVCTLKSVLVQYLFSVATLSGSF